jgi:hypothetical protein
VTVNCELRLAIQDSKHFFHGIVEVFGWPASWHHLATQDEIYVHVHSAGIDERRASIDAEGPMGMAEFHFLQIRVSDSIGKGPTRELTLRIER